VIFALFNAALYGLKLLAIAAIIYFVACIFAFAFFIFMLTFDAETTTETQIENETKTEPRQQLLLPPAKERGHNQTERIENDILIPPTPKKPKQAKPKTKTDKKAKTQTTTASNFLQNMTSKELLSYAKQHKIKGYSAIYRAEKKPGLLRLIQEQAA
jgi:hypothetical protein